MSNQANTEIIINETNLKTGIVKKEFQLIYSNYFWHKVYVLNAIKYSRDFVLRTIMKSLHPHDFIPVCYSIEGEYVTFMLKNCGDSINQMCRLLLTIPHPDTNKNLPSFKLAIALKHAHASELKIEIQINIANILKRRYNAQTRTLNLEAFVDDPDLIEFCPLSQPKLMYFVLHLSRDFEIECLKLNYNEIEILKPLEALQPEKCSKNLAVLDLQRNNIMEVQELQILKLFPLTEVMLKDNPFYSTMSEPDYIKLVKELCPIIVKVDNIILPPVGLVLMRRNYVCNLLGQNFVDQFLEHFFTLYDSHNRHILSNMYHQDAFFTITSQYSNDELGTHEKLFEFKKYSRNLKTLSDLSKGHDNIFIGPVSIANMLKVLPETEHDPYTFTIDLMHFTEKSGVITITGVFKEPGQNLLASDYYFFFTRTFVLQAVSSMEYQIINEMLHISNATATQQASSFKVTKVPRSTIISVEDAKTVSEKNEMINALVAITNLRPEWAVKLLKEFEYNFKKSLGIFMDLYKADKFPSIAFDFRNDMDDAQLPTSIPIGQQNNPPVQAQLQPVSKLLQVQTTPTPTIKITPVVIQPPIASGISKPLLPVPIPIVQPVQRKHEKKPKSSQNLGKLVPVTSDTPNKQQSNLRQTSIILAPMKPTKSDSPIDLPDSPEKAPLIQPKVKPNIKINIQKPHSGVGTPTTTTSPALSPDSNEDCFSTNSANLKKYVKDPLILRVLNMTIDSHIDHVKENLNVACQQVLKHYTCAIKYYKAIGREFYRFQLFSEARIFLADAMAIIPKKMGEQLYCVFTLFEIQYGDVSVAENMILIIAETLQENKAANFLTETVSKINVGFARKVFGSVAFSALEPNKKITLLKAYVDFEKSHGNVDTIKHATKVLQDATTLSADKQSSEQKAEFSVAAKESPVKTITPEHYKQTPEETKQVPNKEAATSSSTKNPEKSLEEKGIKNFEEFRKELLLTAGIMPRKIDNPLLSQFLRAKDKNTVETQGETLLKKYGNNFYIIRIVWKTWQTFDLNMKIAKSLNEIKQNFKNDTKKLNPLILYLKVREDLDKRRFKIANNKLFTHIKISSDIQIIQVFEDFLEDMEHNPSYAKSIMQTLKHATANQKMAFSKTKLLSLIYLTFCQRVNSTEADAKYNNLFNVLPFYPGDCKEKDIAKNQKFTYTNTLPTKFKTNSVDGQIEEMRMYYTMNLPERARHLKNIFNINAQGDQADSVKFRLASAYFETIYGSPSNALNQLRKLNDTTFNSTFISIYCLYKLQKLDDLKVKLKSLFEDVFVIMNPHAQQLLYKYYKQWVKEFNMFDMVPTLSTN